MTNVEIAAMFRELAALLGKKKENWFKIRSYLKVAEVIEKSKPDLSAMARENRLGKSPAWGKRSKKRLSKYYQRVSCN